MSARSSRATHRARPQPSRTGGPPGELARLGVEEIASRVRRGEVSAGEVFEACFERTLAVEPALGAYLAVLADAGRARAAAVDRERAAGRELGPLAGVPVALKDNLAWAGAPLTCGSRILDGYVSPFSATAAERLAAAGAVVLGKTNLDEFAMGSSCEASAFHPTRNPWDLSRVSGGSSGGSAAAVASRGVPLALGSDTGGSVRQPAAFCGVVGLRPTWGRVSRWGLVAFSSSIDAVGPLARSVRDAALAFGVIAGPDPRDATCSGEPVPDPLATLEDGIAGLRVGVIREVETGALPADVARDWQRSLGLLRELGAKVHEVSVPNVAGAVAAYQIVANSEASANLARFDGVRYGRRAAATSLLELYRQSRGEGFGAEVKRRIVVGTFALSAGYHDAYYGRAKAVAAALGRQLGDAFARVDVVVTPTAPSGAFPLGDRVDDPLAMYLSDVFTAPASLAGLPALTVPSGRDADGLPLGLQIIAPPFAEPLLFRVGRAFETAAAFDGEPALGAPPR